MAELKPIKNCPFCGGKANFRIGLEFVINCLECNAYGPNRETLEAAIDAWNKRS